MASVKLYYYTQDCTCMVKAEWYYHCKWFNIIQRVRMQNLSRCASTHTLSSVKSLDTWYPGVVILFSVRWYYQWYIHHPTGQPTVLTYYPVHLLDLYNYVPYVPAVRASMLWAVNLLLMLYITSAIRCFWTDKNSMTGSEPVAIRFMLEHLNWWYNSEFQSACLVYSNYSTWKEENTSNSNNSNRELYGIYE